MVRFPDTYHGVPDSVYEVEEGVQEGEGLHLFREHGYGIEDAAEEGEGKYDEGVQDAELLEALRP